MPRGRKPIALGPKGDAIVASAIKRGATGKELVADLRAAGIPISLRTAVARLQEHRGRMKAERSDKKTNGAPVPLQGKIRDPEPLEITDLDKKDPITLEKLLEIATAGLRKATQDGNFPMIGQLTRAVVQIEEARRKAKGDEPPDPEDDPDLRMLGQKAAAELHKMVDQVVGARP